MDLMPTRLRRGANPSLIRGHLFLVNQNRKMVTSFTDSGNSCAESQSRKMVTSAPWDRDESHYSAKVSPRPLGRSGGRWLVGRWESELLACIRDWNCLPLELLRRLQWGQVNCCRGLSLFVGCWCF